MTKVKLIFPKNTDHNEIIKSVVEKVRTFLSWLGDMNAINDGEVEISILKYPDETKAAFQELGCKII